MSQATTAEAPELKLKPLPDYSFARPYARPRDGVPAFIVDIDGTTMQRAGRGIHDYHRVSEDVPHASVVTVLRYAYHGMLRAHPDVQPRLLWLTGRPERCRDDTADSIRRLGFPADCLYMRPDYLSNGKPDYRPDYLVKYEIFDRHLRDYDIMCAFDDRLQVVGLWRHLGILCLDVAGGAF